MRYFMNHPLRGFGAASLLLVLTVYSVSSTAQETRERPAKDEGLFSVSEATTYITEPIRKSGFVDYAAAINARLGKEVTPENNACVLLYRVIGNGADAKLMPANLFEKLGMDPPLANGDFLRDLGQVVEADGLGSDEFGTLMNQQAKASTTPWTREQYPTLAKWIDANETQLRLIHQAVRRDRYYLPVIVDYGDGEGPVPLVSVLLPSLSKLRDIGRLLCVRAMLFAGEDKLDAAWQDLHAAMRLARLCASGATLIEGLVGYAIEGMAHEATVALLSHRAVNLKQLGQIRQDTSALPAVSTVAEKVDLTERCMFLDTVLTMAQQRGNADLLGVEADFAQVSRVIDALGPRSIDWDTTLRVGNEWYDKVVKTLELPSYGDRRLALGDLQEELQGFSSRLLRAPPEIDPDRSAGRPSRMFGEYLANVLAAVLLPALDKSRLAEDRVRQRGRHLEIAIALESYRLRHGSYPDALETLSPEFVDELPTDLFADASLKYRRTPTGYLLYSVGENTRDDRGRTPEDQPKGDDLKLQIDRR